MKTLTKFLTGAAVTAALTISAASPAQAQYGNDKRDHGIDTGDVIAGVAVLGGIAAIVAALDNDGQRYGYDNRYQYRDDYTGAVNACGYEAQRYGQGGQVSITDVDRRSSNRYRVRGVINAGYAYSGNSYGRSGSYDRYGRYDPYGRNANYGRYGNTGRYGNYGYNQGYNQQVAFACTARSDGRVTDFDIDRNRY
jgi:hypothetical protein